MKKFFDIFFSLFLIIILLPLLLLISLLIFFFMGWPIFFIQSRPGKHSKVFNLYKFRTMKNKTNDENDDAGRITWLGNFLRKTSLDELPELLNVLKQDMSFVGPRPLLVDYLEHYDRFQMKRHKVLPGITGWAQINGRNKVTWDEKFKLDVWYVENNSFLLDMKIIFITFIKVLLFEGISPNESVIMKRFDQENYDSKKEKK